MSEFPKTNVEYPIRGLERPPELDDDPDKQHFTGVIDFLPEHELRDSRLTVKDPLWGIVEIGEEKHDAVFIDVVKSPAFWRLFDVEQLGLPRNATTIPNTSILKRAEHAIGSAIFTRLMAQKMGLSEHDSMVLQLEALVSDVAHTVASHEGDKMFQNDDRENLHDEERPMYANKLELSKLISFHGFDPEEILNPKSGSIVDRPKPELCVDRIDYGLREIRRWIPEDEHLKTIDTDDFAVDDSGEIYMTDQAKAKAFAEAFLELSREHWSEPVHRLQLDLYGKMIKRIQITGMDASSFWSDYHPRDLMYGSEYVYNRAMRLMTDSYGGKLNEALTSIGRHERTMGWQARRIRVANSLGNNIYGTANPIEDSQLGRYPLGVSVETKEDFEEDESMINIPLKKLRVRQVDPKVVSGDGKIRRLSEVDADFREKLETHQKEMSTEYIAKIAIARKGARLEFVEEMERTEREWQKLLTNPRMPADVLKEFVRQSITSNTGRGLIKFYNS